MARGHQSVWRWTADRHPAPQELYADVERWGNAPTAELRLRPTRVGAGAGYNISLRRVDLRRLYDMLAEVLEDWKPEREL